METALSITEIISHPLSTLGAIAGFVVFAILMLIPIFADLFLNIGIKINEKQRKILAKKLLDGGYTAYSALTLTSKLDLPVDLTHAERVLMQRENIHIFSKTGTAITMLSPLYYEGEIEREDKPKLMLIKGGKKG